MNLLVADFIRWMRANGCEHLSNTTNGVPYLIKRGPMGAPPTTATIHDLDPQGTINVGRFVGLCATFGFNPDKCESWVAKNPAVEDEVEAAAAQV